MSSAPAASIARWAADQVAPAYWRPNADIVSCHACARRFDTTDKIHHCRACGEGFCAGCSAYQRPVPERGWGGEAVRVCGACRGGVPGGGGGRSATPPGPGRGGPGGPGGGQSGEVQVRRVGETVVGTVSRLVISCNLSIPTLHL